MRIHIETLGCKMNFSDSEKIAQKLLSRGMHLVESDADIVIINTCTVTHIADKKSQERAGWHLKRHKKVIVTGCSARVSGDIWREKYPDCELCPTVEEVVDLCMEMSRDLTDVQRYTPLKDLSLGLSRTRKNIVIQEGCDTYCAYCIIPFARGRGVSRPLEKIIGEIQKGEDEGYQEIVLTGINLAAWGCSHTRRAKESKLASLLEEILKKTRAPRIRISSIGPEYIDERFFEVYASPRICDHLHISIQSCSENVLHSMNRGHGYPEIQYLAQRAREVRPDTALTGDVIVGFPGETEGDFEKTYQRLKSLEMLHLHVFPYSVRRGTYAEKMKNLVDEKIKKERANRLRQLDQEMKKDFIKRFYGKTKEVLWEKGGQGLTTNYLRIQKKSAPENRRENVILTPENIL